jgi:hypothetical protein
MSIMAGFDLVVEVTPATALRLIQANVSLGGVQLAPPFTLDLPLFAGSDGYASVIVSSMSIELVGERSVRLFLNFENTSIISKNPALEITLLDGTVTIDVVLQLVDLPDPGKKALAADLGAAVVDVVFSAQAQARINAAMRTPGVATLKPFDYASIIKGVTTKARKHRPIKDKAAPALSKANLITGFAKAALGSFVQAAGLQVIPAPTFNVVPGNTGSISRGQFERLVLRNISNESIGLFGMLLPEKPMGDPGQKVHSIIPASKDVSIEIGEDAFHRLIFCANLAGTGNVSALPPACGTGSLDRNGVTITQVRDSFGSGKIDVDMNFSKSGTCYNATGSVHAAITLNTVKAGGQTVLSASVAVDEPSIDVDVPWYCSLASVVLGPIGLLLSDAIQSSARGSADDLKASAAALTGAGGLTFGTGGLSGVTIGGVTINPEEIVLSGLVAVDLPIPASPELQILGSVTTAQSQEASSGFYLVPSGCMEGAYPYKETLQQQSGTFLARPTLLGKPVHLEWRLECWQGYWGFGSAPKLVSAAIPAGASLTLVLDGVTTGYPFPLPGGSSIVQPVHIDYETTPNTIKLSNRPGEGNFGFILSVTATDPAGHSLTAHTGVGFEGDHVAIFGGYQEKMVECASEYLAKARRISIDRREFIPPWVPVNYPPFENVIDLFTHLAAQGTEEAEHILAHAKLAHASSFQRALVANRLADGPARVMAPGLG